MIEKKKALIIFSFFFTICGEEVGFQDQSVLEISLQRNTGFENIYPQISELPSYNKGSQETLQHPDLSFSSGQNKTQEEITLTPNNAEITPTPNNVTINFQFIIDILNFFRNLLKNITVLTEQGSRNNMVKNETEKEELGKQEFAKQKEEIFRILEEKEILTQKFLQQIGKISDLGLGSTISENFPDFLAIAEKNGEFSFMMFFPSENSYLRIYKNINTDPGFSTFVEKEINDLMQKIFSSNLEGDVFKTLANKVIAYEDFLKQNTKIELNYIQGKKKMFRTINAQGAKDPTTIEMFSFFFEFFESPDFFAPEYNFSFDENLKPIIQQENKKQQIIQEQYFNIQKITKNKIFFFFGKDNNLFLLYKGNLLSIKTDKYSPEIRGQNQELVDLIKKITDNAVELKNIQKQKLYNFCNSTIQNYNFNILNVFLTQDDVTNVLKNYKSFEYEFHDYHLSIATDKNTQSQNLVDNKQLEHKKDIVFEPEPILSEDNKIQQQNQFNYDLHEFSDGNIIKIDVESQDLIEEKIDQAPEPVLSEDKKIQEENQFNYDLHEISIKTDGESQDLIEEKIDQAPEQEITYKFFEPDVDAK